MLPISLKQFVASRTQTELAEALGYTRANISSWLTQGRDIYIQLGCKGEVVGAYEYRKLGKSSS